MSDTFLSAVALCCRQCGAALQPVARRDLTRKKYCSRRCRQLYRCATEEKYPKFVKPKGIQHNWNKQFGCKLCGDAVIDGTPRQIYCKECVPDRGWRARARLYGIGRKTWNAMLEKQGGTCALCRDEPEVIDHDHETGRIRGLLCTGCNIKIACLDDHEWLCRAVVYIKD